MTTIAAPPRRAPTRARTATRAPAGTRVAARDSTTRATKRAPKEATQTATRSFAVGRVGGVLAVLTILALVTAVVFHVVLAQNQMELDHLNGQIVKEQRTYERKSLAVAVLASPQRMISEAERLGLVQPDQPAEYLYVPGAPMPKANDGSTASTISDWSKTKPSLGPQQP